jgi:hypothetical protein
VRIRRAFAPSFVVIAACSSAAHTPKPPPPGDSDGPDGPYNEFRDGVCKILPDCTPPPGENFNPCNPPPPEQVIACPPEMLPTQPPDTTITLQPDGTCWIACTAETCDAEGPLRVACPATGAAAPTYAANLIVPTKRVYSEKDYTFTRNDNGLCALDEHGEHTANMPCPDELAVHVAAGVVPVFSSKQSLCYYGKYPVECPKPTWHVWH